MKKIILLLSILFINLSIAQKSILQSGPMVGYCEMTEAVIWLQTNKNATIKVEYATADNPCKVFHSENYTSSKEIGYTYHIILDQLQQAKNTITLFS